MTQVGTEISAWLMGHCCPLCHPGEARAALGLVSHAQKCCVGMFPPEMSTSKAVCWACMVWHGCNLGEHCSGEALLTLVSCHLNGSQPSLGKERERAKTAAYGLVLWRRTVSGCALSLRISQRNVCFGKVQKKIFWGVQTAREGEGESTERLGGGVLEVLTPWLWCWPGLRVENEENSFEQGGQAGRWSFLRDRAQQRTDLFHRRWELVWGMNYGWLFFLVSKHEHQRSPWL